MIRENILKIPSQSALFNSSSNLRVLHLAGSPVSDFYYHLSTSYAKMTVQPPSISSYYGVVNPDGFWQLGPSLDQLYEKIFFKDMMAILPPIDVVISHMFCLPGMTSYRAFFEDVFGVPVVGSNSHCITVANDKVLTGNLLSASGIGVAKWQLLHQGDTVTIQPPFVVKPPYYNISMALILVENDIQISEALQKGFESHETLLLEEYIPGGEFSVAVIERNGELYVPPIIEYLFDKNSFFRELPNHYEIDLEEISTKPYFKSICPANVSKSIHAKLAEIAKQVHFTLGCRDYSLYNFRIHQETNKIYLVDINLLWSFNPKNTISEMIIKDGLILEDLALELWNHAFKRKFMN